MVKNENPHLPLHDKHSEPRSEPDAPPGFPPQPPLNMNGSAICEAHLPNPNSSGEEPPGRTTARKRARPQFYAPPPSVRKSLAAPRRRGRRPKAGLTPPQPQIYAPPPSATPPRRGRPPKARLMPHLSTQGIEGRNDNQVSSSRDIETRNCDQAPSTHLLNNQVIVQSPLTNISPMPHEIEASGPANGYKSAGNVDQNGQMIDPMILQHVSSALHGSQTVVDETKLKSSNENLVHMLKAIYKKHGDITQGCSLESDCMKTLVLLGICKVVQDLQGKQLEDLDISTLDSYYTTVRDAKSLNINVQWLLNRLDEIREAVKLADEVKGLVDERKRRLESVEDKKIEIIMRKVELQRLELEIQKIEELFGRDNVMVECLNRHIGEQTSKIAGFLHKYLMDGLVN
ncbi:hypothetical protein BUALT_Bualt06G0126700 [Buddleja alternifolia]|uniref:Uncharacterized protein n=1 Tax=Buddleja alternifolia TaxID=168488 RepID=A0AAV6XJ11_9LAMI|nr:hypothetical protein BUALT_Bualt06G0126700 [Buddleja alternifolia]